MASARFVKAGTSLSIAESVPFCIWSHSGACSALLAMSKLALTVVWVSFQARWVLLKLFLNLG